MTNIDTNIIADIENLTSILIEYCEKYKTSEEIQKILVLSNCIYDKVSTIYMNIQNSKD